MEIGRFKLIEKGGLLATFTLELEEFDVRCKFSYSDNKSKYYIQFPQETYTDREGKKVYTPLAYFKGDYDLLLKEVTDTYKSAKTTLPDERDLQDMDDVPF